MARLGKIAAQRFRIAMILCGAVAILFAFARYGLAAGKSTPSKPETQKIELFKDSAGVLATYRPGYLIDRRNPFFDSHLGSNGRACATCHQPRDGWAISVEHIRQRFRDSDGLDPLFRPIDGAGCPSDDFSNMAARRKAYALLLAKGLIRVSLAVPHNAEFKVIRIEDPYHCSTPTMLSVYRRPLPATNERFSSTVLSDGRFRSLKQQAIDAALTHLQAKKAPPAKQLGEIVAFEQGLYTAQITDKTAGPLDADGALGGPAALAGQKFFRGINDPFGHNPTGAAPNVDIFFLFQSWDDLGGSAQARARAAIARGQQIFDNRPMTMIGVAGLNDARGASSFTVTCGTCHDTPSVGNSSAGTLFNIGTSDSEQSTPDLPRFTLRCGDGTTVVTSDPGQAMVTGKCADIGKLKVPSLRGLAAHPPYFHNGTAATLMDAVTFYDNRFIIGLSEQEKEDLVAFLNAL
ncbi:MAG: hypothetical protein ACREP6_05205 [Candidatus Binataceae bacterium]